MGQGPTSRAPSKPRKKRWLTDPVERLDWGSMVNHGGKWETLLTGSFERSLDEKGRLGIPKELRHALGTEDVFYLAPGTDRSLTLFGEAAFAHLAARLAEAPPTGKQVRAFGRLFFARARRAQLDRQFRIRIPAELVEWADLTNDVVLLGVGDHMEIWPVQRWREYTAQQSEQFDQLAESAFNLPK